VPKALQQLSYFKRETPLTQMELIKLYQIALYIDEKVTKKQLADVFSEIIPKKMVEAACEEYEKFDRKITYDDVQSDLSHKLLKLRVTFEENVPFHQETPAYIVNFKLHDKNEGHVILLKGEGKINATTKEWLTLPGLKLRHLRSLAEPKKKVKGTPAKKDLRLTIIDVDEWREMKSLDKLNYLHDITKTLKVAKERPEFLEKLM
jgi:hypothetical protein